MQIVNWPARRCIQSREINSFGLFGLLGKFEESGFRSKDSRFHFVLGDIQDSDLLKSLLPGHDIVINFAAKSHVDRSITDPSPFFATNVLGMQTLLQASLDGRVKTFVQVSTDEVYGTISKGSWTERSPLLPNSPYAASKGSSDLVARSYCRTYGWIFALLGAAIIMDRTSTQKKLSHCL